MTNATAVRRDQFVTIDGRDYATPRAWETHRASLAGDNPDQHTPAERVRLAASRNECGLADAAVSLSPAGKIKAYPVDGLNAWEAWRRRTWKRHTPYPTGDATRLAERLGIPRIRVLRALKAGTLGGRRQDNGTWVIDESTVDAWIAAGMPAPRT